MASKELKKIVEQLNKQGAMAFIDGATPEQILAFEKEKGVHFPDEYKEWLLFSDGGECFLPGGIQLYGVAHKPVIDVDENDRPDDTYIVVGALSTGDPILFKNKSEEISIYNHEAGVIEQDEIYPDFFAFLKDLYELLGIGG